MTRLKKQLGLGFLFVFILFMALAAYKAFQISKAIAEASKMGPPPQAVTTTTLKKIKWNKTVTSSARVDPINGALIKAQTNGTVLNINFVDGTNVTKDQLLVEIEAEVEKAEYKAALAKANLAKKSLVRQEKLFKINAISQEEYDTSTLNSQALIAAAEALKARVDRKLLKAPFNGNVGVRRITIGQYVKEGDPLFQLQDDSKTYLSFSLGQADSIKIKVGNKVEFENSIDNEKYFAKIVAIDPNVALDTGTKLVKAEFDSHPKNLAVGTFGKVIVTLDESYDAFVIPATSIQHAPYGDSIFLAEESISENGEKSTISNPIFVKIADYRGDLVAIKDGLKDNQEIVTSGTFKLQKGTKLIINNSMPEKASEFPNPKNS